MTVLAGQALDRRGGAKRRSSVERRRCQGPHHGPERRRGVERRAPGHRRGPTVAHVVTLTAGPEVNWSEASCTCGATLSAHDRSALVHSFAEWHEAQIHQRAMVIDCR